MLLLYFLILLHSSLPAVPFAHASGRAVDVISAEQGAVILLINETRVTEVSWIFSNNHIATTWPDGRFEVKNHKFKRRLHGMEGGSLKMTEVTWKDRGTYTANVFIKGGDDDVHRKFHLKVYPVLSHRDIDIRVDVTSNGTCSLALTCLANASSVAVSWDHPNASDLYESDQTLHLYPADPNATYKCTAKNPVSNVSKTITPWQHCQEEVHMSQQTDGSAQQWIVPAIVTLMIFCSSIFIGLILFHCKKLGGQKLGTQKKAEVSLICDKVFFPDTRPGQTHVSIHA